MIACRLPLYCRSTLFFRVIPAFYPMGERGSGGDAEIPQHVCAEAAKAQSRCETKARVSNPVQGVRAIYKNGSFNLTGVGSFQPGDRRNRGRPPRGLPANPGATKSSTTKGPITCEKGLPVSYMGDDAELQKPVADG